MSRPHISQALRNKLFEAAGGRCGYCLNVQEYTAMPLHIEHIMPIALGGSNEEENLWLACPTCNNHKATKVSAIDPETQQEMTLFNPRTQNWFEHFAWSEDGLEVKGITDTGRATVPALQLNNSTFVKARRRWVLAGWHPPTSRN